MTARADLVLLTDDALALVANRGLVKRAARMNAENPPALTESTDHIVARFTDGTVTDLPASTPFTDASCTCGSSAVCRHRIGLVLAYRDMHRSAVTQPQWSPAEFDDDALGSYLGASVLAKARRIRQGGYSATVHRAGGADPAVRVELPHCTVRFLVPHELGHAHSSASAHSTAESIALAVWAVRTSDEAGRDDVYVSTAAAVRGTAAMSTPLAFARNLLLDGVAGSSNIQHAAAIRMTHAVASGKAVWVADACSELTDQLDAYTNRHARHNRIKVATIIAEIHARVELGSSIDAVLAAQSLGTNTTGETPLRRSRLIGLGARVTRTDDTLDVDVYFTEPDSNAVYLLGHRWTDDSPTGHSVASRRVAGTTVRALAASTVVTESAVRRANRRIRLGRRGIGRTSILPLGADAWAHSTTMVRDYADARRELAARRPSFSRERLVTDGIGVLAIASVTDIDYAPADQTQTVLIDDALGNRAKVIVEHRSEAPGAIEAVLRAMSSQPRAVAGRMSLRGGSLVITPFAVACDLGVVVPDLEPAPAATELTRAATAAKSDPLGVAVTGALSLLADLSHRGLRHATDADRAALRTQAEHLSRVGMQSTSCSVLRVADAVAAGEPATSTDAWVRATLRLMTADESR